MSGSVRRTADAVTAHGVAATVHLRVGSSVSLRDADPGVSGRFQVEEVWHRCDGSRGLVVEFVALGGR